MENKPVVTITGVSGYLGSHVCLYFLKSGEFKVRGTVRSKTNAKKIEPLRKAFGEYFDQLELVEADLNDKPSLQRAVEGSEYVVHTASPYPLKNPKTADELIRPAVDGTLAILDASRKHKVKRCVITSSIAACTRTKEPRTTFFEDTWSDPGLRNYYSESKTKAELAAWKYVESLPASEKFELATILPAFIIGPSLIDTEFSSAILFKMFMLGKMPGCPKIKTGCIDVRDCAEAHFKALTVPEAAGKRLMLSDQCPWFREIGEILHQEFGKHYKVSRGDMSKCVAWAGSFFNYEMAIVYKNWGREMNLDNSNTRKILGLKFTDLRKSFKEMGESLIELGVVPDKRN